MPAQAPDGAAHRSCLRKDFCFSRRPVERERRADAVASLRIAWRRPSATDASWATHARHSRRGSPMAQRYTWNGPTKTFWLHSGSCIAAVLPSVWPDPCPTTVLEAMASGRPVVTTSVGGIIDMVTDGESGLLVPPGDERALAAAIRRVLSDGDLRSRLGAGAQKRAQGVHCLSSR